jgi:hypothetical protein
VRPRTPVGPTVIVLVAVLLTGCSAAVDDGSSFDPLSAGSTTLPTGTPADLLPQLVATVDQISEAIIDEGDQRALLAEAEALWTAAQADVAATNADAAESMQQMMDLARVSVERVRPADADKATKFLGDLVDAYLADGSAPTTP